MAHGHGAVEIAVKIAVSAAAATAALDEDTRVLYFDLIEAALSEAARKAFAMLPEGYEFQGPTFQKGKSEGKLEGRLEGKLEGKHEGKREGQALMAVEAVLTILDTRGLVPSAAQRERLVGCDDLDSIKAWIAKAVTTSSVDALFDE